MGERVPRPRREMAQRHDRDGRRRDNVAAIVGAFIAALPDLTATEQVVVAEGNYQD